MGMYNEVNASCPECEEICEIQISEVVPGFGEFYIGKCGSSQLEKLSQEDKEQIVKEVNEETFYCQNPECNHHFKLHLEVGKPKVQGTIYI